MTNLLLKASNLQKTALTIINQPNFKKFLSNYGSLKIVGSVAYNLMTWPEIDLDLVTPTVPTDQQYWTIVQHFFSWKDINSLTLADNRKGQEKNRPKSMYLGLKYKKDGNMWKIDLRLLTKENRTNDAFMKLIKPQMTNQQKEIILQIKSQLHHLPSYHKTFSSIDIYQSVIKYQVKNLDQFKNYLVQNGKKY